MNSAEIAAVVTAVAATAGCLASSGEGRPPASCIVATRFGSVQGVERGSACVFLGIPFALPPVGELRWNPPQPAASWAPATFEASAESPACPSVQPGMPSVRGSEDCLRLNIWTPRHAPATPAAVIVWLHAGAFVAGSASMPAIDGKKLAVRTGAIVVTPNYRLGPLGFLGHHALTAENPADPSSGNYGLLDQRAALAWVRDNIAAFGGDPRNVTIAGQSAGAHSVSLHIVSPKSAGLFGRAIMQSGFASTRWRTLPEAEKEGDEFATALGCTDPSQVMACLRAKPQEQVVLALPSGQQQVAETARASWSPVVDGVEIPDQPRALYERGRFARVPVIVGTTRDEGWEYVDRSFPAGLSTAVYAATIESEFGTEAAAPILAMYSAAAFESPKHALARLTGDVEAVCEARRIARLVEATGAPVYLYSFEREPATSSAGVVVHRRDTNFVFGNNFDRPLYVLTKADLELSHAMSAFWTRFAATGNPNGGAETAVEWPEFGRGNGAASEHVVFDSPIRIGQRLRAMACDFWQPSFLRSVVGSVPASAQ